MSETRTESDSMGEMQVPGDVLYGASTQRAVLNFPVSGRCVPMGVIRAYATLKSACAKVNQDLGDLDGERASLIQDACEQILEGLSDQGGLERHFPVDVFQTGSGTSTNMNANEVIANLVCLARNEPIGSTKNQAYLDAGGVHPNNHVNMGQSSNDTFPTAMNLACALALKNDLDPALAKLETKLADLAERFDAIVKIGRTHLQDATPIRLGQEFSGYASQIAHGRDRVQRSLSQLAELALGGTAVGTGLNTRPDFGGRVATELSVRTGLDLREADNHFEAQHAKDAIVETSAHLRTIAISLSKIANDIRWMGSGPRCGIGELKIPAVQPGSSIMPGKVNPVICEAAIMVSCRVIGNDATVGAAGLGGVGSILDLAVAMPVMAEGVLDSIQLLTGASHMFVDNLLNDLEADADRCNGLIEGSLAMVTSLVPVIGYDLSAKIAYQAFGEGKTVREILLSSEIKTIEGKPLTKAMIDEMLDARSMTEPRG